MLNRTEYWTGECDACRLARNTTGHSPERFHESLPNRAMQVQHMEKAGWWVSDTKAICPKCLKIARAVAELQDAPMFDGTNYVADLDTEGKGE